MNERIKMKRLNLSLLCFITAALYFAFVSCNNPFKTRTPSEPTSGGVAIKPANTPENVLYNMRVSFEALSIQDYLDVFSEDFIFNPDTEDSIDHEEQFLSIWNKDREIDFANNFFIKVQADTLHNNSVTVTLFKYEYRPGQDMYEYDYTVEIDFMDEVTALNGRAWLFLRESDDGKWYIRQWVDHRYEKNKDTWGVLRANNI